MTDPSLARRCPELAVLSAMTHCGTHPERDQIYRALLAGLEGVNDEQATLYHDVLMAVLPEAARRHLEASMSTRLREYQSEFARKYVGQGRVPGGRPSRHAASRLEVPINGDCDHQPCHR